MKRVRKFVDILGVLLGSFITAVGVSGFFVPNKIAAGGASGIATLLYYLFGWSPGIVMLFINIPLIIAGGIIIGFDFSLSSILGGLATSFFVFATENMSPVTTDPLLGTLFGGIVCGLGMGIVFRSRGSTAGTDILARIINKITPLPLGQSLLATDGFVVLSAAFVFNTEFALYALIGLYVTGTVIDLVQEGISYTKAVYIISNQEDIIAKNILEKMERGVTEIQSRGAYTKEARLMLLVVCRRNELAELKQLVYETDRNAFVIVSDAHEVLGEGFRSISKDPNIPNTGSSTTDS